MRGEDANLSGIEKILKRFAASMNLHSEKTERKLDALVESVTRLTESHIESKKDREYDSKRMERIEENQKSQGAKIEKLSETVLIIDERVNSSKEKWAHLLKFLIAIITAVILSKLI